MVTEGTIAAGAETSPEQARGEYVARHFRRNFLLMLLDAVSFPLGSSFISVITILPLFVREITDSTLAVGMVTAVNSLGMLLPALFIANVIERKRVQKWYLFWVAMLERLPLLLLAGLTPWLGRANPEALLVVFFVAFTVHSFAMGLNMPAYFTLFAKVIPPNRRGRMWGFGGAISGALALGGTWLVGQLLARYSFPDAYALIFLLAFIVLTAGILGFPLVREPPATDTPAPVSTLRYLKRAPSVLRRDGRFGLFVMSQVIYGVAFMATAFYTAYAIDRFGAGPRQVALFTAVLMGTNAVADLILGLVADRHGYKPVLQLSMGLALAAPLLAVLSPSLGWMYVVFALNSFVVIGFNLGSLNMPLEFAPRSQVPTYSAISMTAIAPVRTLVPLLGGVLASGGYMPVFLLAAAAAGLSLALFSWKVQDPRHTGALTAEHAQVTEGEARV